MRSTDFRVSHSPDAICKEAKEERDIKLRMKSLLPLSASIVPPVHRSCFLPPPFSYSLPHSYLVKKSVTCRAPSSITLPAFPSCPVRPPITLLFEAPASPFGFGPRRYGFRLSPALLDLLLPLPSTPLVVYLISSRDRWLLFPTRPSLPCSSRSQAPCCLAPQVLSSLRQLFSPYLYPLFFSGVLSVRDSPSSCNSVPQSAIFSLTSPAFHWSP